MRRLEIVLIGRSRVLSELYRELQEHGHTLHHLNDPLRVQACGIDRPTLLIDDGSLALDDRWFGGASADHCLSLRVGLSAELSHMELLGEYGTPLNKRLIIRQWHAQDTAGNGRQMRDAKVAAFVDLLTLQVSRLSRDPMYFASLMTAEPAQSERQDSLVAVDRLLFEHRFNQTTDVQLLEQASTPLSVRLGQSLITFAGRPALTLGDHTLSYAQLQAQAVAIQQQLRPLLATLQQGNMPPVVGICLPKCTALFAGVLAILGCGAVYLPLDPNQPAQRQRYILENAGAVLLLHDGQHCSGLSALDISVIAPAMCGHPLASVQTTYDSPCMALYTSGTTGQPKGVLLSQYNLSHFTAWYANYVELSEHSRVLQFSTLSFDSSVIDIFPTLLSGAELVVADEDQRRDPLLLADLLRQGISHAFVPPALLSLLPLDEPLGLTHLVTGGDVCEPHVIERLSGQCRFHNLYGPTEATVLVTARRFEPGSSNRNLGQPIANSQVWILDEQLEPVAEQVQGELYIAGPGVALGYLNNPQLTAERYVELALPDGQRLRAYRTGDLGKWTATGIELGGRRDNQVKIRGFRVEPEEIEHCLRGAQMYRQAAVVIDDQRRILAFVAKPHTGLVDIALAQLKTHVRDMLPDYMQPALYKEVQQLPFASNGKVDRKALLALPLSVAEQGKRRMPETEQERRLLELWADLLELAPGDIGTDESFFNLGGHSILLSRLLLAVREHFGRSIPINRFIEAPSIQTLGRLVSSNTGTGWTVSPQALRDAHADLQLPILPTKAIGDVQKVIVTGANGFLGVHVVQALLEWGATEVACLVREGSGHSAQERFTLALQENRLEHLDLSRVTVHAADIRQPRLGLSEQVYERLDLEFGALVHNAANVNHVQDYETLAGDSVAPIFECLKLCEGRSKKVFNFISTLSASSSIDANGRVLEQPAAATPPIYIKNGYNLSKWVAERTLERARALGAWVNIYRPGNIAFNSVTGVCQPQKNRLMLMLKGSLQLGQVPDFAINFDLMPVDFLARFIGFHASRYQPDRTVFNLHNPEPLSWTHYVEAFREAGREFELVSIAHWQSQLGRVDSQNALFGVLGFYLDGFEEDIGDISMIEYHNALAGIRQMGEHYPRKTPALLRKGCAYLKEIDFI